MEVLVDHGEMEIEYDHLYNYAAFSRYPTGSSKNQRRIIRRKDCSIASFPGSSGGRELCAQSRST